MELFLQRRYRSPLLLAVIFITFFHSVLSRHKLRHYKDRFKRQQGAHLYLPESYVTEGDEGSDEGPWLDWSEPSPCSRTCGGGVSTQHRQCQQGYTCRGPEKRHFSCNTQDCPDTGDFRAQQCSEYDEVPFENIKYQWVPYTKGPNPCELNCMPKGQRFYYRHASQVIDGTRCNDENFDVCVSGKCQPVGCDMMLGSNLKEDECRVCGGDGSTCNTISNTLELNDLQVGYNDVLLIPGGATNIVVEEVAPSNNYFAIRNTSGHYYLNGNWRIDLPRAIDFAGSKFHYERYPQGFAAPDKIYTLGPIDEPLFIVLLYQDTAVPVQYKYSLPTNVQPGSESETYAWTFDEFTPCTATCGGGIQHRNVSCAGRKTLEPVDETLCEASRKPETSRKCNEVACEANWVPHQWGNCSKPCGEEGGVQTREISCQQIVSNGYPTLVDEAECHGPKPPQQQKCNQGKTCAKWHTGPWKPCDHLCGNGTQTRLVQCFIKDEKNKIQILDESQCEAIESKPAEEQGCFVRPCEGVDWISSAWSGCDSVCGLTNETRKVFCATHEGQIYGDDLCEQSEKPEVVRKCEENKNVSCNYLWYASQWSECSAKCGKGIQTRTLFCGLSTPKGVEKVEKEKCDQTKTFETIRNCTGTEECDGEWFSGPWGECSKPCGGGKRNKKVLCVKGIEVVDVSHCDADDIEFTTEDCNKEPCTEDSIIPVDKEQPLPTQEKETEKPTTEELTTEEETTVATDKETEGTQSDISPSEISELTKSFEITTEPEEKKSDKESEDEDDYEIVPSDSCDDGEWVDVVGVPEDSEAEESELTETTDFLDRMYSDGSTPEETPFTGSGDGETSPSTEKTTGTSPSSDVTEEEGSGSSSIVTDEDESSVVYKSSSQMASGSTEKSDEGTGSTVSGSTEAESAGTGTTEAVSGSSESATAGSSSTDLSVSSGSSETSTDMSKTSDTSDTSESSTTATIEELPPHECQAVFDACATLKCLYGVEPFVDENQCLACRCRNPCKIVECPKDTVCDIQLNRNKSFSQDDDYIATCLEKSGSTETDSETTSTGTAITSDGSSGTSEGILSTSEASSAMSSESTVNTETTETTEITTETTDITTETTEITTETTWSTDISESTETTEGTTEISSSSSDSSSSSGTTEETDVVKEEPGADIPTPPSRDAVQDYDESVSGSTEISGSTESSATETTTEFTGSTDTEGSSISTTEIGSTTEVSGSTVVSGSTEMPGSTEMSSSTEISGSTEMSGSTEISSSTEVSGSTEVSTTEVSGSTETTESGATESTTEFSGSTEFDIFSSTTETSEGTTWPTTHITEIFKKKQKMCKRKKIMLCQKSKYGCCWDKIHSAKGPFDQGCPKPKTCKESEYGCCPDGVSAALGPKNRGCPSSHCNETLFGCCWDEKTPAEGNEEEGCPPKPPACLESKWGCCKDNVTEAKGPKQKGCEPEEEEKVTKAAPVATEECSKTDYGCCPDGSPAKGPQYQGCNMPCSNTTFGCCPDQETPAHGHRGEGCCLTGPFGCCPDDITPARGAGGDGCECKFTAYGCCPDNVTAAKGYNNEGCGCKHSEHGCCPDDATPASGPDYEGCLCHTYQFGCCPDGISIAEGPHEQGCDCRNSDNGCCPDEKTPAQGPNKEGCGCEHSKFGCCLDGVSEAKGENFEGCEEVPIDHQNACSLPKERGPCRNYTVKWFFDMSYGGCSRFWYGGCDGNDNRFKSREECEGVCVKPEGKERCNLPKVQGSCEGYFLQWYHDKESRHCTQFVYGGCLGNNNRFETREECADLCASEDVVDPCEQSEDAGPCHGQFRRYFFEKQSGQCREFAYGGCKGNNNNFATTEACKQRCATPGKKRDYCTIPKAEGNCTAREAKWYYEAHEQRCLPFYYTGCNGNRNSFDNREACEEECPTEVAKDTCHLPADIGECGNYVNRWYWDTKDRRCKQFYYGGCGGNGNNYRSEQECDQSCSRPEPEQPQVAEPVVRPRPEEPPQTQRPYPVPQVPSPTSRAPTLEEICSLVPEQGPCTDYAEHYYYDGREGVCKTFTYGGCGGNYNNFENEDMCLQYCGSTRALPQEPVRTEGPRYGTQAPPVQVDDSQCYEEADPGNCTDAYPAFYFDRNSGRCQQFTFTGCGGNRNRFYSEEDCERRCGEYKEQDICNMEREPGPCRGYFVKYYFDRNTGRCEQFAYGGCNGNGNRFTSAEECEHYCGRREEPRSNITSAEVCQQPADQGSCPEANNKRWYFDNTQGECKAFIYTGCGGNQNNFKTFQSCLDYCKDFLPYTAPPQTGSEVFAPHECQAKFDECNTLRCPYGIEAYVDEHDCNGCRCRDPCKDVDCPEETQCSIDLNRNKTSPLDADFVAICRERNKPGQCPYPPKNDSSCDNECQSDADCALHLKCCDTSCGTVCVEPARPLELVTQTSEPGYTQPPSIDVYYPPRIDVETYEPEVTALLGDQAVLNCAVTGNPNPKISWSKDNIMIDGTQPRYRIRLDQTLQIITLHKTDSGIYLCTAENNVGNPIQNQIKLEVQDSPVERPVKILNGQDPELLVSNIVTSFNSPATLNCYALGWPMPAVTWWKEDELIPLKNREFEVTKEYSLIVHSVQLHNLGVYTCQAYNGKGKAASWSVTIRAKGPYYSTNPEDVKYLQYVVNPMEPSTTTTVAPIARASASPLWAVYSPIQRPTPQPYIPPVYYSTEPSPDLIDPFDPNEILPKIPDAAGHRVPPPDVYIVPVRANITTNDRRYPTGSNIEIRCDVYGYPSPQVAWYKDGIPIVLNEKLSESETHTLTIKAAEKSDSGRYQCEAYNQYSKASSTLDVLVEGMYIHPSCTDNQFFANCKLIVKAKYCNHKYYAKFCCRSCTEAGELPVDGPHLGLSKQSSIDTNTI